MFGLSSLVTLLVIWAAVTTVLAGLLLYRYLVAGREDDQLFLNQAESSVQREQQEVLRKLNWITPLAKGFGAASILLVFAMAGLWLYQALQNQPR